MTFQYYQDLGKPTPRVQVMNFLKAKEYSDAKDYAGECEPVVIMAKGQSTSSFHQQLSFLFPTSGTNWTCEILLSFADVQGTCKYGTRVDYVLTSPHAPYKFVPGSYSVVSSKGTSDHHIVKVDVVKQEDVRRFQKQNHRVVQLSNSVCSPGIFLRWIPEHSVFTFLLQISNGGWTWASIMKCM